MEHKALTLEVLDGSFGVCRLAAAEEVPSWAFAGEFSSVTRTRDEVSVVCPEGNIPEGVQMEKGWRCLRVVGPLDFAWVGIMAAISGALAQAEISIFAVSTYDTDYIMVKEENLAKAVAALQANGYIVG